ncbi:MAG: pilus assembly PilX N-terminal domain-containing protein, partial [Turicibacter sp.]
MKKKKGSSMVLVLLLAAAIMMIGTVSITSVSMNVKLRVEENKRIQSLYGADSGLEYANELLLKTYDNATLYAEKKVQHDLVAMMASLDETNTELNEVFEVEMNKKFKEYFTEFIETNESGAAYGETKNAFTYAVENGKYAEFTETTSEGTTSYGK